MERPRKAGEGTFVGVINIFDEGRETEEAVGVAARRQEETVRVEATVDSGSEKRHSNLGKMPSIRIPNHMTGRAKRDTSSPTAMNTDVDPVTHDDPSVVEGGVVILKR